MRGDQARRTRAHPKHPNYEGNANPCITRVQDGSQASIKLVEVPAKVYDSIPADGGVAQLDIHAQGDYKLLQQTTTSTLPISGL